MRDPTTLSAPPSAPPSAPAPPPAERDPRTAVRARMIVGAVSFFVIVMVGLISLRWASVSEPSAAVVVAGDASLKGAWIVVDGEGHKWAVELDQSNDWENPILLNPGNYHIVVTHHDYIILDRLFVLSRSQGLRFDLPSQVVVVGNPQLAANRIELSCVPGPTARFEPVEISLSPHERYSKSLYLPPGHYHAVARNVMTDQITAEVDFGVDRTQPLRVDLARAASDLAAAQ